MGGAKFLGWVSLTVAALTCGTLFLAIRNGPQTVTAEELADERSKLDPRLGERFELGNLGGEPVIVVTLGTCMGCTVKKADFSVLRDIKSHKVIGIYEKNAERENVSQIYPWLDLAEDKGGLHRTLNSYWTPRVYAFDEAGTLTAMQGSAEDLRGFLSRVEVAH